MTKHLMVDLETLAVSPQSVILTLGAIVFDPYSDEIFDEMYVKPSIDEQLQLDRAVDDNTIKWWSQQDPVAKEEAFSESGRIGFEDTISAFHKFAWGCNAFWSHGAIFDLVILQDVYRQLGRTTPWNFWQCRDTRTLFDLGFDPEVDKSVGMHNALEDARRQVQAVQTVYKKIRYTTQNMG